MVNRVDTIAEKQSKLPQCPLPDAEIMRLFLLAGKKTNAFEVIPNNPEESRINVGWYKNYELVENIGFILDEICKKENEKLRQHFIWTMQNETYQCCLFLIFSLVAERLLELSYGDWNFRETVIKYKKVFDKETEVGPDNFYSLGVAWLNEYKYNVLDLDLRMKEAVEKAGVPVDFPPVGPLEENDLKTVVPNLNNLFVMLKWPIEDTNYYRILTKDGYGLMDKNEEVIVQPKYDSVIITERNRIVLELERKYGIIDMEGNIILPIKYSYIDFVAGMMYGYDPDLKNSFIYDLNGIPVYDKVIEHELHKYFVVEYNSDFYFIDNSTNKYKADKAYNKKLFLFSKANCLIYDGKKIAIDKIYKCVQVIGSTGQDTIYRLFPDGRVEKEIENIDIGSTQHDYYDYMDPSSSFYIDMNKEEHWARIYFKEEEMNVVWRWLQEIFSTDKS